MSKKSFNGENGKKYVSEIKKPFYKKAWFWIIMVVLFFIFIGAMGGESNSTLPETEATEEETVENNYATATFSQDEVDISEEVDTEEYAPQVNEKSSVTTEYKSALIKATSYANVMDTSKKGVYDQLISEYGENFSAEASQYAIDNVQADWNNNALKKAESYQNDMAMSPNAIYDQLIFEYGEQFTPEQAQYAINNLN